jgi:uncharacterized protein YndB with AHSA1/START domain
MSKNNPIQISKDVKNKKVNIKREFNARVDLVWKAWTESKLLDQWWAPKPWVAKTKSYSFKEGGSWLYAMSGPDGTSIWSIVEFSNIQKNKSFEASSSFSDENGNKNASFPTMHWKNVFIARSEQTTVEVEISFEKEADIEQIIAMGFEAGFTAALGNLEEMLQTELAH